MKIKHCLTALILLGNLASFHSARAAVYCSMTSSPDWFLYYTGAKATATVGVTVSCSRDTTADSRRVFVTLAEDSGMNAGAPPNVAVNGGNTINYGEYTNGSCGTVWTGGTASINFGGGGLTGSNTVSYTGCVPAGTAPAAGTYTDTVTTTITNAFGLTPFNNGIIINGTNPLPHNIVIGVNTLCAFTTPPSDISLNYVSQQLAAASGSTSFSIACNSGTPYTMALDSTAGTGTSTNLNYTLGLSAAAGTGTGSPISYIITATIAAGQAGTCASGTCNDTMPHTLMLTF